jgi:hypothetical protein
MTHALSMLVSQRNDGIFQGWFAHFIEFSRSKFMMAALQREIIVMASEAHSTYSEKTRGLATTAS